MTLNTNKTYQRHYTGNMMISTGQPEVFAYVDDHTRLSSHMNKSSWMMGGGRMDTSVDAGHGQEIGSHIRMNGRVFGISLFLDEVVTHREPPHVKIWQTVGTPKLLVIGHYRMKVEIELHDRGSLLQVSIDYDLPTTAIWLGKLFGGWYAKWCVQQVLKDTYSYFTDTKQVQSLHTIP